MVPCAFGVVPCAFAVVPCAFAVVPCAFAVVPCAVAVVPCAFAGVPCAFAVVPFKKSQYLHFPHRVPLTRGKLPCPFKSEVQGLERNRSHTTARSSTYLVGKY